MVTTMESLDGGTYRLPNDDGDDGDDDDGYDPELSMDGDYEQE